MNDRDPLDRTLSDAFARVCVDPSARPSMHDVRARARRRHHRRTGATLGAVAAIGVGGAVAFAARDGDGGGPRLAGDGADVGTATTSPCVAPPTTILLPTSTTIGLLQYTIQEGDTPAGVAAANGVTVEQLDAANTGLADYASFAVGLVITVPTPNFPVPIGTTTTIDPRTTPSDPCGGAPVWHCTGPLGSDDAGRDVYEYCEPNATAALPPSTGLPSIFPPTTSPVDAVITSSTVDPSVLLASTTTSILEPTPTTTAP